MLAQGVVLVLALAAQSVLTTALPFAAIALDPLLNVLTVGNAAMIVFNLLPVAPLDGHRAWRVLRPLRATLAARFQCGTASLKRAMNVRKRRAIAKDADNKVVDLLERIKKNRK